MYLTAQQVLVMDETRLMEFVGLGIEEGLYLDYKEDLSGDEKKRKREFLKDVTAFANAAGGHILLGVKQPSTGLTPDQQVIGVNNGRELAASLERLASTSIDPRVSGLLVVPVDLTTGKGCIVVHVPPSLGRPHMVTHDGHRSFYIRHTESSVSMSTHEIREAVLTSESANAKARQFVERQRLEARRLNGPVRPALFMQAMPLIAPAVRWAVLSEIFETVVRGDARQKLQHPYGLVTSSTPRPTIEGVRGERDSKWRTEIHSTGYISMTFWDIWRSDANVPYVIDLDAQDVFRAFCHLLNEALSVSGTDVPYLVTCAYFNASSTCVVLSAQHSAQSAICDQGEIVWPEYVRATGEDASSIAEDMIEDLYHAFGLKTAPKKS